MEPRLGMQKRNGFIGNHAALRRLSVRVGSAGPKRSSHGETQGSLHFPFSHHTQNSPKLVMFRPKQRWILLVAKPSILEALALEGRAQFAHVHPWQRRDPGKPRLADSWGAYSFPWVAGIPLWVAHPFVAKNRQTKGQVTSLLRFL